MSPIRHSARGSVLRVVVWIFSLVLLLERPCATSLVPLLWERGVTALDENPDNLIQGQIEWPSNLPATYVRRHVVGVLLSIATPSLKKLKDFRADLESGRFEQQQP